MEVDQWYIARFPSVGLTCTSRMVNMFCPMPFHSDKGKGNIPFFIFPYSKFMEVDQLA